jgi:hypothetical protein
VPNTATNPSQSEPTAANVPSHARENPLLTRAPRTRLPSWSSARRCWVGRQVNCEKPATGAVSSRFSSQLPSFASVRRPSGVTLSCGQAGNTPERPGSRVGKRVGLTATVTATWLRRDRSAVNLSVQLAPSTDCHGLWDRPGPDLRTRRSVQQRRICNDRTAVRASVNNSANGCRAEFATISDPRPECLGSLRIIADAPSRTWEASAS